VLTTKGYSRKRRLSALSKKRENPQQRSEFARAAATAILRRSDGLKQSISSAIEIVCIYNTA
jgi:hypothetical protein